MTERSFTVGAIAGIAVGIVGGVLIGPDGWALGGAVAGIVVGARSPDLAGALLDGAKAGVVAAAVFALAFGFGEEVRLLLRTGEPGVLTRGLGAFFAIAIIYGIGCFIAAAVAGGATYTVRKSRSG